MNVFFSPNAEEDIRGLTRFIALDNQIRAENYASEIRKSAEIIGLSTYIYEAVSKRNKHLRRKIFGNYTIYFLVESDIVIILRIIHSARKTKTRDLL